VALIGTVGGLTIVTVVALWAYVKLVKWAISSESDLNPALIGRVWKWFIIAVLLVELGPSITQATVAGIQYVL